MNCQCLTEIPAKMMKKFNEEKRYKSDVVEVEIEKAYTVGKQLTVTTYSTAHIELKGQNRKIQEKIIHSFCPFCGVKNNDEKKKI